jgi:hypothetical protein
VNIREARPDEYAAVGELRVVAYRALGLLPEGSGYAETLRGFGFADGCVVLVAIGEAGSGILGTITLEPFGPANELAQDETEADVRAFAVAPQAKAAQHLYTSTGFSRTPDLDFEPGPGITLRAYELVLPSNPFSGRQPDKQPVSLSLAPRCLAAVAFQLAGRRSVSSVGRGRAWGMPPRNPGE